ncbi:MAG: pilus assembly protein [Bacilli bacterium]|nr:pilus assembly protein [Bacilli bacterium]
MNRKGQALVEFVLVLPILIFILLLVVDLGRLMIMRNHLESILTTVTKDTTVINDKEYKINIERDNNYIILKSCTKVYTPGLSKILGNPTCVRTSKEIIE